MTSNTENKSASSLGQEKVEERTTQKQSEENVLQRKEPILQKIQAQENKPTEETTEDPNWKAFREARKKDRLEREIAEKKAVEKEAEVAALKAAMEAAFSKGNSLNQQQYYSNKDTDQHEETEDERIEKKIQILLAQREAVAEQDRQNREKQEYPHRLAKNYSDFHQVIAQDNLDYLDFHYPEVSRPLQRLQDGYDKWSDIYQAIKKFVPNNMSAKKDASRAESNSNKPKSMSSTGITQPGESRSSSNTTEIEARRAARYAVMKRIINGVG